MTLPLQKNKKISSRVLCVFCVFCVILAPFWGLLVFPLIVLAKRNFADAARVQNWAFGRATVWFFRPLVSGSENLPQGNCVMVFNHRSLVDIFWPCLLPYANTVVVSRSYLFKIPVVGFFMRLAGYFDSDNGDWEAFRATARLQAAKGLSFLFFPEGHRSKDGQVRRFKSGAFHVAVDNLLPIVPVCVGNCGRLRLTILPPLRPGPDPDGLEPLRLAKRATALIREALVQQSVGGELDA